MPLKSLPSFRRRKDEPEHVYMDRVDRETKTIIKKEQFENKYKVDDSHVQACTDRLFVYKFAAFLLHAIDVRNFTAQD